MIAILLAAALQAVATPPLPAAAPPPTPGDRVITQAEALQRVAARGQLLYDHDRAAWVSTDTMREAMPGFVKAGVRGYIVEPQGEGYRVTYHSSGSAPVAIYVADVVGGRVRSGRVVPAAERAPLSVPQIRLIAARDAAAASAASLQRCTAQPYNSVVLAPQDANGAIHVYLLAPQPSASAFALGGHHQLVVGTDGRVASARKFANSCLVMDAKDGPQGKAVGMVVSHLLGSIPTEIHVWTSLASGKDVYVSVPDGRLWAVQGARIRLVNNARRKPKS